MRQDGILKSQVTEVFHRFKAGNIVSLLKLFAGPFGAPLPSERFGCWVCLRLGLRWSVVPFGIWFSNGQMVGLRGGGVSGMCMAQLAWTRRNWALPFLSSVALSILYHAQRGRR